MAANLPSLSKIGLCFKMVANLPSLMTCLAAYQTMQALHVVWIILVIPVDVIYINIRLHNYNVIIKLQNVTIPIEHLEHL